MEQRAALTSEERDRFARQLGPGVLSESGQLRLRNSTALVTRVGGMGGPAAQMLTMGGIGRVIIAHGGDLISPDLNRQVLGSEAGLNQPRAEAFGSYLRSISRFVQVEVVDHEPNDTEALDMARSSDVILSCAPAFGERLRLNRASVATGKPLIDAAQWGMNGTLMVLQPGETPCLQCVYPIKPDFEELFPVVGAISSAIGSMAALEAIKILSGCGRPAWGRLQMIDGFRGRCSAVDLRRAPDCKCCQDTPHRKDV